MQKLIQGLHTFQREVFTPRREQFERLAGGQSPEVLFITCSDSRIDPGLMTQTGPGDLFVIRNAGNMVPPSDAHGGGEGASVEYAVAVLGVKDVVVCGHTGCGAMKGLLHPEGCQGLPSLRRWLRHAEPVREIVEARHGHLDGQARLAAAVEENVIAQLDHLRGYPAVASKLQSGELRLHGWIYELETGMVMTYDARRDRFAPLQPLARAV